MAESETMLRDHVKGVIYLLENLGFVINLPKSLLEEHRLSGILGQLSIHGTQAFPRKDQEYQSGGQKSTGGRTALRLSRIYRKDECSHQSYYHGPPLLSTVAGRPAAGSALVRSRLQHPCSVVANGKGGARMVEHTLYELEWVEPISKETERHSRGRCVALGLGRCMSGY